MDSVHPGGLGGTYGGNPVSCAAALAVLEVIESEDILSRAEKLGEQAKRGPGGPAGALPHHRPGAGPGAHAGL